MIRLITDVELVYAQAGREKNGTTEESVVWLSGHKMSTQAPWSLHQRYRADVHSQLVSYVGCQAWTVFACALLAIMYSQS